MKQHTEDDIKIAEQFQKFQPYPTQKAYERMANGPWTNRLEGKNVTKSISLLRLKRIVVTAILICAILSGVIWVSPPLRSMAQEIINTLFNRATSDSTTIEYQIQPTPINTLLSSKAQNFTSVEEAQAEIGIHIHVPQIDLHPFTLTAVTVNHDTQTVWLIYNTPGNYLSVYQRSLELGWLDEGLVGASAKITPLVFENRNGISIDGNYVEGGWQANLEPTSINNGTVQQHAEWTTETSQRRLRWQDEGLIYEMVAVGISDDISLQRLITIAASMK